MLTIAWTATLFAAILPNLVAILARKRMWIAIALSAIVLAAGIAIFKSWHVPVIALPPVAAWLLLVSVPFLWFPERKETHAFLCVAMTVFVFFMISLGFVPAIAEVFERRQEMAVAYPQLRAEYPVVNLRERLDYEHPVSPEEFPRSQQLYSNEDRVELPEAIEEKLSIVNGLATSESNRGRGEMLQLLHESTAGEFVEANGFGVGRFQYPFDASRLPLESAERMPLDCERPIFPAAPQLPATEPLNSDVDGEVPSSPSLWGLSYLHLQESGNFLLEPRLGYAATLDETRGFQPHAFTRQPAVVDGKVDPKRPQDPFRRYRINGDLSEAVRLHEPPPPSFADVRTSRNWYLRNLQLVSLLKHNEPRAYITENLPNMEELSSDTVPTRTLDEFEQAALARLQQDEDIVIDDTSAPNSIRMFGSLRADIHCLSCHSGDRGRLLGAFTYTLIGK